MCVFKIKLATDDGDYKNQNVNVLLIMKSNAMKSCTHKIKSVLFQFSAKGREYLPQLHCGNSHF